MWVKSNPYQHCRITKIDKYETGRNNSGKYGIGKYGYLSILQRVINTEIYFWRYTRNMIGMW